MAINESIQESYLYDVSLEGGVDNKGNVSQVWQAEAIGNALKLWIISRKGDYLDNPNRGGYVIQHVTKPMNDDRINDIKLSIINGLAIDFEPKLTILSLDVIPVYTHRYWNIHMRVYSYDYNLEAELDENLQGV